MNWMLTFKIMPDETIIEDSSKTVSAVLKPTYTVFLTTKRLLFRFNAVGSTITQSFTYQEIEDAQVVTRLLIPYLCIKTKEKEFFIHVPNAAEWPVKILETKKRMLEIPVNAAGHKRREELHNMLITLQRHHILTAAELEDKIKLLDELHL